MTWDDWEEFIHIFLHYHSERTQESYILIIREINSTSQEIQGNSLKIPRNTAKIKIQNFKSRSTRVRKNVTHCLALRSRIQKKEGN